MLSALLKQPASETGYFLEVASSPEAAPGSPNAAVASVVGGILAKQAEEAGACCWEGWRRGEGGTAL